jgi:hypothetical protein
MKKTGQAAHSGEAKFIRQPTEPECAAACVEGACNVSHRLDTALLIRVDAARARRSAAVEYSDCSRNPLTESEAEHPLTRR